MGVVSTDWNKFAPLSRPLSSIGVRASSDLGGGGGGDLLEQKHYVVLGCQKEKKRKKKNKNEKKKEGKTDVYDPSI